MPNWTTHKNEPFNISFIAGQGQSVQIVVLGMFAKETASLNNLIADGFENFSFPANTTGLCVRTRDRDSFDELRARLANTDQRIAVDVIDEIDFSFTVKPANSRIISEQNAPLLAFAYAVNKFCPLPAAVIHNINASRLIVSSTPALTENSIVHHQQTVTVSEGQWIKMGDLDFKIRPRRNGEEINRQLTYVNISGEAIVKELDFIGYRCGDLKFLITPKNDEARDFLKKIILDVKLPGYNTVYMSLFEHLDIDIQSSDKEKLIAFFQLIERHCPQLSLIKEEIFGYLENAFRQHTSPLLSAGSFRRPRLPAEQNSSTVFRPSSPGLD